MKLVLFVSSLRAENNPLLRMYTRAMPSALDVVITCVDDKLFQNACTPYAIKIPRVPIWGLLGKFDDLIPAIFKKISRNIPGSRTAASAVYGLAFFLHYVVGNICLFFRVASRLRFTPVKAVVGIDGDFLLASWLLSILCKSSFLYSVYEIWPHQLPVLRLRDEIACRSRAIIEKCLCLKAARIITVDISWAEYLAKKYELPKSKFSTVTVCPPLVTPKIAEKRLIYAITNSTDNLRVHYHGAYLLSRGLDDLLAAFKVLDCCQLFLRGLGPDETVLREYVNKNSINDRVFFLPPVPVGELVDQAIGYDVGIILAKPDTANGRMCTGFKFFEYLNSGLAILSPSSPPLLRLTNRYGCGVNYGWPSPEALSHEIKHLRDDRSSLQRMKLASIEATKLFNASAQSKALRSLLFESNS